MTGTGTGSSPSTRPAGGPAFSARTGPSAGVGGSKRDERPHALRVMHVITGLGSGGAEAMLTRLVLARRDFPLEQRVVSLVDGGRYAADLRAGGITVDGLGMRRGRVGPTGVARLAGLIRRYRPGVIQSWMYHADLIALMGLLLSGRRRRTRLYWGIRASFMAFDRYGPLLRPTVRLGALLSAWPDGVVVNSAAGRAYHRALGYRPRKTMVIRNGIDCARFAPMPEARAAQRAALGIAPDAVVAVAPARVDPMKDHATLIRALDRAPALVCLAAGTGTENLPARPNLIGLGHCDDVRPVMAAADIVVSSSIGEGFSNAVAEGMAMGLPAVATNVGDAVELVGETGEIVPPSNPEALAAALVRLAADADRRLSLGRLARQRVIERFSLEAAVAAFDRLHRTGEIDEP